MEEDLKIQIAYMDGEDFLLEIANASCRVYPSEESIEKYHGHTLEDCGIAKVEIRFIEWVKPSRFDG